MQNKATWLSLLAVGLMIVVALAFSKNDEIAPKSSANLLNGQDFLEAYQGKGDAILIDVRTPEEFQAGRIGGAVNIDFYDPTFTQDIADLDKDGAYFIYCHSGNRSSEARRIMEKAGISNIYELKGGVSANPYLITYSE